MATQLENNTTELQAILDAVNALPEAGGSGGGGKKTVTVTITGAYYTTVRYVTENNVLTAITANGQTVEALGGIILNRSTSVASLSLASGSANLFSVNGSRTDFAICTEDGTVINTAYSGDSGGGVN